MGCGASAHDKYTPADGAPLGQEHAEKAPSGDSKVGYADAVKARSAKKQPYDVSLSYDASYSPELYKMVAAELGKDYKVGSGLKSIKSSRRLIIFLSPPYFTNKTCCAEFCEAVSAGVEVVLICVDGSTWAGNPFPSLDDVPAEMRTDKGGVVRPRDAASILLGRTIAIEHKASYLPAFVEKLYVPIA